jgi:adenylate kinase family enzyme
VRRILVYGVTGSGKSTMAARLGERLGLPYHDIDALAWEPGWVEVPDEIQRERVRAICATEEWVIDAAYQKWVDIPLARVELIVGLDMPRPVSYSRLIRRTVRRIVTREQLCNGNYETFRNQFLQRDALLLVHFGSFSRKRTRMRAWRDDPAAPEVVLLRSPREADRWVASLSRAGQA